MGRLRQRSRKTGRQSETGRGGKRQNGKQTNVEEGRHIDCVRQKNIGKADRDNEIERGTERERERERHLHGERKRER
jgi:hypothetical protein